MVQWQLCTLEHLMNSGYGRPFPRHGLQLLFWFANQCVNCELVNFVVIMKLASDCQPERGSYGFHWFGNAEQLLPVMNRPRKSNSKKQEYHSDYNNRCIMSSVALEELHQAREYDPDDITRAMYFEVGNLNTETYAGSADLPAYVRENYGSDGNRSTYNIDRIIISCQVRTRVVETVYVTEHDRTASGRFSPERTYQISAELIQVLQSPLLDITTFLTQMGYYAPIRVFQSHNIEEINCPEPSAQQMLQTYSGSTARTDQNYDLRFFPEDFQYQLDANMSPFSYDQQAHYTAQNNHGLLTVYKEMQHICRTQRYPPYEWYEPYEGFDETRKKKKEGGGFSLVKLLLGAGALYLAVKCFSWLRSWWTVSSDEHVLKMIPWRSPIYKHTHIMLDYVY